MKCLNIEAEKNAPFPRVFTTHVLTAVHVNISMTPPQLQDLKEHEVGILKT